MFYFWFLLFTCTVDATIRFTNRCFLTREARICQTLSFAPREFCRVCSRVLAFLCWYRTDHICFCVVPSGTLFLLFVRQYFSLLFFSGYFNTQSIKCACGSGGSYAAVAFGLFWLGGRRAMRRQKSATNDEAGGVTSCLPVNSEGDTSFAQACEQLGIQGGEEFSQGGPHF